MLRKAVLWGTLVITVLLLGSVWLAYRATTIVSSLESASDLVAQLRKQVAANDKQSAVLTANKLQNSTIDARDASEDPIWTFASTLPGLGPNFSALAELARSADDIASLGILPLVNVYDSLDWEAFVPSEDGTNLEPLRSAAPVVGNAAYAVSASTERLESIDTSTLLPEVAQPLTSAREELRSVSGTIETAADASELLPALLGTEGQRSYLLMIQNSAESRASGGIPGALAILTVNQGRLSLGAQSSAGDLGVMDPVLPLDPEQRQIYSARLGKYMQDVNLTPDFPTAASTAQAMWEEKTGQKVQGVVSIDPVVLSYILRATGPVSVDTSKSDVFLAPGLPSQLTGNNVVKTLLSDVYQEIAQPKLQDAYFAGVAREIFVALSGGKADAKGLIRGLTQGVEERRVLMWSADPNEQSKIRKYKISGSITGPSVSGAEFGVYFNDGTGAKMDYYVKRSVQLTKQCSKNGYEQVIVRVVSTNTAPPDAAHSLPAYVTGGGHFGVSPGSVQTNVVAYGPAQSVIETTNEDGQRVAFSPHFHDNRPVGVYAVTLAPGESKILEFTFGKIVQHTEPNVAVTPSVQPVKDVTLATESAACS
ncbi:hypothetical protein AS031_01155 [Pseudarthrobacter enclensis]|uniref:Peptide synthetase n=1 Tax=Pseudarthrobacter enclensis TaxID=993070 RepID=A0A0V8IX39_9MICC|nr:hypothetical protein AS031_01155 [Pseudarthrobacter enclensis]